jgi:hypothetical protein
MESRPAQIAYMKELTIENWLERDDAINAFARLSSEGIRPLEADDLARRFLYARLSPLVPENVKLLFRTAQGALVYGYFFYPLFALGKEQLMRVAEAAIGEKFKSSGGPPEATRMKGRIDWLCANGHLGLEEGQWWDITRRLRNHASHLEFQSLKPPGETAGHLIRTAHAISCLFDPSMDFMSLWE